MKANPLRWLLLTCIFAILSTLVTDHVGRALSLFLLLAGSGGQLAVENAKFRLLRGKVEDI